MGFEIVAVLIISTALIAAIVIRTILAKKEEETKNKVKENSEKITLLLELNKKTVFHQIPDKFDVHKHYDNKSNFLKVEPSYLMTAKIRSNILSFSDYITKVKENRVANLKYQEEIRKISSADYIVDYDKLELSNIVYRKYEDELFSEYLLHPVIDCTITILTTYSSPKGEVNLSKKNHFSFDDLFTCFESVSRSHLDKSTAAKLKAVERGEVSDSLRYDILNRDNFTCVICGASAKQGARLHVDHIIPVSKGGKSTPDNLRTLCERCNIGKSDKIEDEPSKCADISTQVDNETAKPVQQTADEKLVCEICGANLVLRHGKYNDFYGCTNYPKCKYTKQL